MSEERDALELELEAMRPCQLPQSVRGRIAEALARDARPNRNTAAWWWGGLVAAAACLAIAGFAWHLRSSPVTGPGPRAPEPVYLAKAPFPDATLGSYKLAFARSNDRFDALLDKEAARPLATTAVDSRPLRPFDLNLIP